MKMITRNNYELWFLDYLEGNLDERLVDIFLEFLRENPDLAEELHLFEAVGLTESDLVFSDKKKLYKESYDLPDVFDSAAIGFLEGDIDRDEMIRFNRYMKHHPEKNRELQLFKLTKLIPESSLIFRDKQRLYRQPFIRLVSSRLLRVAAILVFICALSMVLEKPSEEMISGNPRTIFISENHANQKSDKIDRSITVPAAEVVLSEPDMTGNIPGKRNLNGKKPDSRVSSEFHSTVESSREYHPSLLAVAYSSPVNEIQSFEPELMTPAFFYEIVATDDPANVPLSRKFFQKIGLSRLNPEKVVRWSLTLAANLTREKFNYTTDATGEIIALNLDTRLVGLSIPVNKK
jgi:hypothetical protein